jgi:hypothetical protein
LLLDPDLEKLAIESRSRLTREFAEKYADLRERVNRVPVDDAKLIAEEKSCPLEVAIVAYIIDLDGIMSIDQAVELLTIELQRRTKVGSAIPNLPGNIMEFAINEGRWIEYIYGSLAGHLELKVRELSNLESYLNEDSPPIEKVVSVMDTRNKLASTVILPVLETWIAEHVKSNSLDLLMAFCPAITKWNRFTLLGKLERSRIENQELLRDLRSVIETAVDSATMDAAVKRIDKLIENLDTPFDKMNIIATSHLILHIIPRPKGRGDISRYIEIGMGTTRGSKAEPDMKSPFDFLERDVKLAIRRAEEERDKVLLEKISRVIRVLKYQGKNVMDSISECLKEITERMDLHDIPIKDILSASEEKIASLPIEDHDSTAVKIVKDFVDKYVYGE